MKKRTRAFPAMALRITALVMGVWLAAMAVLTWAVAEDFYGQLEDLASDYVWIKHGGGIAGTEYSQELPGSREVRMIDLLGNCYNWMRTERLLPIVGGQLPDSLHSQGILWGKWDLLYGYDTAEIFQNASGAVEMESGNYLTFVYTDETGWVSQNTQPLGRGYLDLENIPGGTEAFTDLILDAPSGDYPGGTLLYVLRMTGRLEGSRFHPVTIERGRYYDSSGAVEDIGLLSRFDSRGSVEWEDLLTLPDEGGETVTVYTWENRGILKKNSPITVNGTTFSSLTELAKTHVEGAEDFQKKSLLESVIIRTGKVDDNDYTLALRCWPLQFAMLRLVWVYLLSFALLAFLTRLVLSKFLTAFSRPLSDLAEALEKGRSIIPDASWQELRILEEHFVRSRQAQAEANAELQQLRTALDYAKNAEENRRQLVSNITHELKTPLAVIHSYAEGLQAGIAEEKREQYLNTILEETERMDAMVLQMLDLSRLEAGKVRLTMSRFSLLGLTRTVAERFKPMLEAKDLELNDDFGEDFQITADEGRMEQVITNLLSNALKYTPAGGRIGIRVCTQKHTARFYMENTSPHLSREALEKVFDSFYRADPSRTEPGTGLGLTLVKSIIELHRGTCTVRNTTYRAGEESKTAVEFGFELPVV